MPAPWRLRLGLFTTTLCVLMLQLSLTRLFSATMFYHFAFMAISLALFGSAASGVLLYVFRDRVAAFPTGRALSTAAALFAVSAVACVLVVLGSPLSPYHPETNHLLRTYLASALPFFFAGVVVTMTMARYAKEASRIYFFDLAGAGAGCLVLIPALDLLGAVNTVLLVAALAAAAGVLFETRRGGALLAAALVGLLVVNARTGAIDVTKAKGLEESGDVIFAKWNSFSRVTVSGRITDPLLQVRIDADASTAIRRGSAYTESHLDLRDAIESVGYHLFRGGSALVIGPGGGEDVVRARLFGASPIVGVELNPIIAVDVMSSEPFRSYSGALYERPGVRLVVDEGRSFIRRSSDRYDLIQATMVDTWAATAAGAFALSENNLYTVEAFGEYLDHLTERGILTFTRWYQQPPVQLLRLVSLARVAMAERGIAEPARRFLIVRGGPEDGLLRRPATLVFKKDGISDEDMAAVEAVTARRQFDVVYTPRHRPDNDVTRLIEAVDPSDVWRTHESDIEPVRDDSPFFFQTTRLSNLLDPRWARGEWRKTNLGTRVLFTLLALTAGLVAVLIVGPLLLVRDRLPGGSSLDLLYFACLGAGYIVIEVALVQRLVLFLGHPVYALTVALFSLLFWSSLGSRFSARFADQRLPRTLVRVLAAVAVLTVVLTLVLPPIVYGLVHLPRAQRIAITAGVLAPTGLALGMPMPIGIRLQASRAPEIIPWAWGVNGATSVLGSVAAVALALVSGFDTVLLTGAALYALALLCVLRRRP